MDTKRISKLSMLLALSLVLSLVESYIPILNGIIPGFKVGFSNIVVLFALYNLSFREAISLSILRVFIMGILRTGLFSITFTFSLAGALLSVVAMFLAKNYTKLSIVGVSIIGAIFHSIGEIVIAMLFLSNTNIVYYLPILLVVSLLTGSLVGIITDKILKYYDNY
ncbi:MAG: Gx transporter family protein [Tenericutes bacterium]|nr:Gx transporter family protein [Mycoplasmatota bacterium]